MSSNNKKQKNVGRIEKLIDERTETIIAGLKKDYPEIEIRAIRKIQIRHFVKDELKRSIGRVGLTATAIALALGIGNGIGKARAEGKYIKAGIELEDDGKIDIKNPTGKVSIDLSHPENETIFNEIEVSKSSDSFEERLKVNSFNIDKTDKSQSKYNTLMQNVETEISALKAGEILPYVQDLYIQEYNAKHNTKYTAEDVTIEKPRAGIVFEETKAQDGSDIVVVKKAKNGQEHGNAGLLKVYVAGELVERGTIYNGEYRNVYYNAKEVKKDKETTELGEVLIQGFDLTEHLNQSPNSSKTDTDTYTNRLIVAVEKYKETQIDKIIGEPQNAKKEDNYIAEH